MKDYEDKRIELLIKAASKPLLHVLQFDGFLNAMADYVMHPDEDGDVLFSSDCLELRNSGTDLVRVQIPVGVRKSDAVRIVEKLLRYMDGYWEAFELPSETKEIANVERRHLHHESVATTLAKACNAAKARTFRCPHCGNAKAQPGIVILPTDEDFPF